MCGKSQKPGRGNIMIQLNLTDEEEQHLKEAVSRRLSELDHEIAHTDSMAFKDVLKRRRETMQKIIEKLPDLAASAA
jgi:hypothetical protein